MADSTNMPPPQPLQVRFSPPLPAKDHDEEDEDEDDDEEDGPSFGSQLLKFYSPSPPAAATNEFHGDTMAGIPAEPGDGIASLTHLQNTWPGKTGNGHHLEVRPMSFYELLSSEEYQIVIPLFQRRYCWTTVQINEWYQDLAGNNKNNVGQHSTHKTMFKKHREGANNGDGGGDHEEDNMKLICIDGQQRTTTATLVLMALRAPSRKRKLDSLVEKIDSLMFQNPDGLAGMKRWAKYQAFRMNRAGRNGENGAWKVPEFELGWLPPFNTMLVPSYIDRAAYFEILCNDYISEALEQFTRAAPGEVVLEFTTSCQESIQYEAFHIFSTELDRETVTTASMNKLFHAQMHQFSIMYIELLTNDNLQQIFLWMQEKTIFGMGRLLHNPHPGIDFTPIDLARNLVVSCVMNEDLSNQMEFYKNCWAEPLEIRFGGPQNLSRILDHLVDRIDQEAKSRQSISSEDGDSSAPRYLGDMEKTLKMYMESVPPALQATFGEESPMMVYARFHSLVQHRALELCGDPNAITREVADSIVHEMVREGESMGL